MMHNDYKTTSDHLNYSSTYDRGYNSIGSSRISSYTSRENYSSMNNRIDTDGNPEFDSGRPRPHPKKSSSEFVLSGSKVHHHTPVGHSYSSGPPFTNGGATTVPPTSSYMTHSDQLHFRQEMIAPNVVRPVPTGVPVVYRQAGLEYHRRGGSEAEVVRSRSRQRDINPTHHGLQRKRSVSPQMPRPSHPGTQQMVPNQLPHNVYSETTRRESPVHDQHHVSNNNGNNKPPSYPLPRRSRVKAFKREPINMKVQSNREESFISHYPKWSSSIPHLILVLSGFFFMGQEDLVQCFSCKVELDDWNDIDYTHERDYVHKRHFLNSPNCPHLRKEYLSIIINDVCLNVFSDYFDFGERFKSFRFWPISSIVSGRKLAEAGFFYENDGIRTQCHRCGVVKEDWKSEDDPFTSHTQLCPTCPHLDTIAAAKEKDKVLEIEYKSYEDRLLSFKNMAANMPVSKEELAGAGFVLIRPPFTVRCPDCKLIMSDWSKEDNPLIMHLQKSSDCSFIKSYFAAQEKVKRLLEEENELREAERKQVSSSPEPDIQYPPSYKPSLSNGSNDSVSLPSKPSFDEEELAGNFSAVFMRSKSTPEDSHLCIVCFENPKECAIVPCGHFCVCKVCADRLEYCPICRQTKQNVLKIYIP